MRCAKSPAPPVRSASPASAAPSPPQPGSILRQRRSPGATDTRGPRWVSQRRAVRGHPDSGEPVPAGPSAPCAIGDGAPPQDVDLRDRPAAPILPRREAKPRRPLDKRGMYVYSVRTVPRGRTTKRLPTERTGGGGASRGTPPNPGGNGTGQEPTRCCGAPSWGSGRSRGAAAARGSSGLFLVSGRQDRRDHAIAQSARGDSAHRYDRHHRRWPAAGCSTRCRRSLCDTRPAATLS